MTQRDVARTGSLPDSSPRPGSIRRCDCRPCRPPRPRRCSARRLGSVVAVGRDRDRRRRQGRQCGTPRLAAQHEIAREILGVARLPEQRDHAAAGDRFETPGRGGRERVCKRGAHHREAGPRTWTPATMSTGRTTKQRSVPSVMSDCVYSVATSGAGVSGAGTRGRRRLLAPARAALHRCRRSSAGGAGNDRPRRQHALLARRLHAARIGSAPAT